MCRRSGATRHSAPPAPTAELEGSGTRRPPGQRPRTAGAARAARLSPHINTERGAASRAGGNQTEPPQCGTQLPGRGPAAAPSRSPAAPSSPRAGTRPRASPPRPARPTLPLLTGAEQEQQRERLQRADSAGKDEPHGLGDSRAVPGRLQHAGRCLSARGGAGRGWAGPRGGHGGTARPERLGAGPGVGLRRHGSFGFCSWFAPSVTGFKAAGGHEVSPRAWINLSLINWEINYEGRRKQSKGTTIFNIFQFSCVILT